MLIKNIVDANLQAKVLISAPTSMFQKSAGKSMKEAYPLQHASRMLSVIARKQHFIGMSG